MKYCTGCNKMTQFVEVDAKLLDEWNSIITYECPNCKTTFQQKTDERSSAKNQFPEFKRPQFSFQTFSSAINDETG